MIKPLTRKERQAQKLILKEIDKAIDLLHEHFKKYCNEVAPLYNGGQKATAVPLEYIDRSVKIIKENYHIGAERAITEPENGAKEA